MTQASTRYAVGDDLPGQDLPLNAEHRRELFIESVIDPDVARERGYQTVDRPTVNDDRPREHLRRLGFPSWATSENYMYPGLWIPQFTPSGQQYAGQWKPKNAVPGRDGKMQRYASAKGPARLDVHPRWSRDRGAFELPAIQDPSERMWITEGVKKSDAITTHVGEPVVALAGVYSWRNTHATLGDWEDVRIRGREIVICFDADAISKPAVAQAMGRLGKWLRHKGAAKVWYLTVPPMVNGSACKGVDDYFAAGGTVKGLEQALQTTPPQVTDTEDRFTDARLAEVLASEALDGRYVWAPTLNWLQFAGNVWREVHEVDATETVRQWALQRHGEAVAKLRLDDKGAAAEVDGWRSVLGRARATSVLAFARGIVKHDPSEFDGDTDCMNTPNGYLDLSTGAVRPLGEDEYPTRITGARFDPDARSETWERFVEQILPDPDVRGFVQRLFGYAMLGEVREHVMPIFTGTGANGKSTIINAVQQAFGTYALEVDPELLMTTHNPRHLTFLMELKGRRLVFCSETEKGRRFAEATMKRLVDGTPIQANKMREDPITYLPAHTLIMNTNHLPKVSGDDPAVWRRVLVVPFDVVIPEEQRDAGLGRRLAGRLDAVLAWAYAGHRAYLEQGLNPPAAVRVRTERYRAESDALGRFLAERVTQSVAGRVTAASMFEAYEAWWRSEGDREEKPLSKIEFGRQMIARGVEPRKAGGVMVYRGVALTTSDEG